MDVPAKLVKKVSKKTGNDYLCIELTLASNYKKTVFLDPAEKALLNVK